MVNPLDGNSTLDYSVYNICNDREYRKETTKSDYPYNTNDKWNVFFTK